MFHGSNNANYQHHNIRFVAIPNNEHDYQFNNSALSAFRNSLKSSAKSFLNCDDSKPTSFFISFFIVIYCDIVSNNHDEL